MFPGPFFELLKGKGLVYTAFDCVKIFVKISVKIDSMCRGIGMSGNFKHIDSKYRQELVQ